MTILIVSVVFTLTVSFFCSLLEATLLSYSSSQVAALEVRRPRVGAIWRNFKDHIEKPIAVILITNTTAHTIGATVAGAQFEKAYGAAGLVVFSIVFTYLMLQFTEILPKSLGVRYNGVLAPMVAPPMAVLIRVMKPIVWFIHLINRPFQRGPAAEVDTLEEIAALASSARLQRVIDPHQARMIQAASSLEDISVRQIVRPRMEVVTLSTAQPMDEVLKTIQETVFTRLPLCDPDIDHVIGMIHVKDVFNALALTPSHDDADNSEVSGRGSIDLREIKRDLLFLPEHTTVLQALRKFQLARVHMAVVVDEYGSTTGIVTLEDVIEEMVGDIRDEFDKPATRLIRHEGDAFRIHAAFPLHELAHHIPNLGVDHSATKADTAGGYLSEVFKRLPQVDDQVDIGAYRWTVSKADERRAEEILLTPIDPATTEVEEK